MKKLVKSLVAKITEILEKPVSKFSKALSTDVYYLDIDDELVSQYTLFDTSSTVAASGLEVQDPKAALYSIRSGTRQVALAQIAPGHYQLYAATKTSLDGSLQAILGKQAKTSGIAPIQRKLAEVTRTLPVASVRAILGRASALAGTPLRLPVETEREGTVIRLTASYSSELASAKELDKIISAELNAYVKSEDFLSDIGLLNQPKLVPGQGVKLKWDRGPKSVAKSTAKPSPSKSTTIKHKPALLRDLRGRFTSLPLLLEYINTNLADQVKQNMGDGTRKDILNLRTGRFAESVEVTRLMQSKQGMITAFYNYMKYPYQTFEPGYKQGSPLSRNPRLLISKSIRELAADRVSNRMRAVLV